MGFRFRKSKKVGPFRINMSQKGIGWSVGVKGLRYTKKAGGGTRVTASIPGTGISYVTDSKKPSHQSRPEITAPDQKLLDQASPAAGENYNPSPVPGGAGSGGGKRPGHGCLWWVVAILFWPFSLSIWFWRSSFVSNKALKAIILAVIWIGALLASGSAAGDTSAPTASSIPASSMIAASSEAEEEEELPAESIPASEPASSQKVQEEADSVPASSQELQETAAASEPAVPASSQSAPAASSEAAAPAPVETEPAPAVTAPAPAEPQQQEVMVWIPATGSKYHSRAGCSGMNNPRQVTLEYAQSHGYEPCKRCY